MEIKLKTNYELIEKDVVMASISPTRQVNDARRGPLELAQPPLLVINLLD